MMLQSLALCNYTPCMIVQKYLVQEGICSRREAERLLKDGLILVNGRPAKGGVPLKAADVVTLAPAAQASLSKKITITAYKPRGVTCTKAEHEGDTIFEVFPQYKHLTTVGRLDKESEGLILLSNDGLVTKKVTGENHEMEKEYEIVTAEKVFPGKLAPMQKGMVLSDGVTLPAGIKIVDNHAFLITLREGRNRQIRRMCGQLNLTVLSLKRIRIGPLVIKQMKPGSSWQLRQTEIESLLKYVSTG